MAMLPEDEARSLGVPVGLLRTAVIVASTMMIRQFMRESVEHLEMHAGLAVLKEESLLEAEEILPDAAAADPTSSEEPWLPCPVTLSVTEISRVVAATRSSVSTRLSEWCAAGLMRKDVRAMAFRPALFEGAARLDENARGGAPDEHPGAVIQTSGARLARDANQSLNPSPTRTGMASRQMRPESASCGRSTHSGGDSGASLRAKCP